MNFEKNLIHKALENFEKIKNAKSCANPKLFAKNSEKSTKIRKRGNELFVKKSHTGKDHEKIWKLYSESVAIALNDSEELATGYANRSALLVHLQNYKDCLVDINRALKITSSNSLKVKLFCRQTECLAALQDENKNKSLAKAKFWLNKVDDGEKGKKTLIEMIEKAEKSLKKKIPKVKFLEKIPVNVSKDAVYIKYDREMDRGLFAARDFKFGEIIWKEKLNAVSCNNKKLYAYCSHCLGFSLTTVPCDSCSYYMFCGEKCKEEAWQKYHDIECSLHLTVDTYIDYYSQMGIRLLIKGFKEAGSIKNLRIMVEGIDKCTDEKMKDCSEDVKFQNDSFLSVCSLRSSKSSKNAEVYVKNTLYILIALAKNATIFGANIDCSRGKSITENNDLLFMGTLLLRLILILKLNAFHVAGTVFECKNELDPLECAYNFCCLKGMSFSPFLSLINHSCDPNVSKLYSNDGNVVYYAVKPITKGTQLFSYYYYPFHRLNKMQRRELLQNLFEFKCKCNACKYNFPVGDEESFKKSRGKIGSDLFKMYYEILEKHKSIAKISEVKGKYRRFNEKSINDFSKDVDNYLRKFETVVDYPIFCFQLLSDIIEIVMEGSYGSRMHVPKNCKI